MALVIPLQEFAAIRPETTVIDGVDECPADIRTAFLAALRGRPAPAGKRQGHPRRSLAGRHARHRRGARAIGRPSPCAPAGTTATSSYSCGVSCSGPPGQAGCSGWAKLVTARDDRAHPERGDPLPSSWGEVNLHAEALSIAVPAEAQDKDLHPPSQQVVGTARSRSRSPWSAPLSTRATSVVTTVRSVPLSRTSQVSSCFVASAALPSHRYHQVV